MMSSFEKDVRGELKPVEDLISEWLAGFKKTKNTNPETGKYDYYLASHPDEDFWSYSVEKQAEGQEDLYWMDVNPTKESGFKELGTHPVITTILPNKKISKRTVVNSYEYGYWWTEDLWNRKVRSQSHISPLAKKSVSKDAFQSSSRAADLVNDSEFDEEENQSAVVTKFFTKYVKQTKEYSAEAQELMDFVEVKSDDTYEVVKFRKEMKEAENPVTALAYCKSVKYMKLPDIAEVVKTFMDQGFYKPLSLVGDQNRKNFDLFLERVSADEHDKIRLLKIMKAYGMVKIFKISVLYIALAQWTVTKEVKFLANEGMVDYRCFPLGEDHIWYYFRYGVKYYRNCIKYKVPLKNINKTDKDMFYDQLPVPFRLESKYCRDSMPDLDDIEIEEFECARYFMRLCMGGISESKLNTILLKHFQNEGVKFSVAIKYEVLTKRKIQVAVAEHGSDIDYTFFYARESDPNSGVNDIFK